MHDLGPSGARQDEDSETSQQRQHSGRRSTSPFRSNGLLAPPTKYRVSSAVDGDDPFRITAPASAPKEPDADVGSGSGSDVEMPGIGDILAEKQARESLRTQKERLQKLKLAALAQQKTASAGADVPADAEEDSDDGLDVVPDTMHSVAREEAAARALAGRSRPSSGRATQLRLARVAGSPQRAVTLHLPTESPQKRLAAAAQSMFLASSFAPGKGNGVAGGRGKRSAGMTKAELERMVLRSAEAQSEHLRREKEEEWVGRGGRVVGVMEVVGDEKVQELIGEALERNEGARVQDGGGDEDEDDDGEYVPIEGERGSASPRPIEAQELGDDGEEQTATDEKMVIVDERPGENSGTTEEADSEVESHAPDELRPRGPRAARTRRHAVIGSDDEDGQSATENADVDAEEHDAPPPPLSLPDLPSPAFTSTASPWPSAEPDHDHENDPDVSGNDTDKENRAVVWRDDARPTPTHGARVLFDDLLSARAVGTKVAGVQALPLLQPSVFAADDDPFAFTPSPAKAREEALRRLESPTPLRVFDTAGPGKRGLSQMFEEEENDDNADALKIQGRGDNDAATQGDDANLGLVGFKPVLGGLSEAFEQTQVNKHSPRVFPSSLLPIVQLTPTFRMYRDLDLERVALRRCVAPQTLSFHSRSKRRRWGCSLRWMLTMAYAHGQPRSLRKNKST